MKILICCALRQEAFPLKKSLNLKSLFSHYFKGTYQTHEIELIITGPGRENVMTCCPEILKSSPDMVVSYGFAGALSPELKKGDILIADQVVQMDTGKVFPISFNKNQFPHTGPLLSVLKLVSTPEEKESLYHRFNALAVDMESAFLCEEVSKRKIKFLAMRGITDSYNENIPAVTQYWAGLHGKMSAGRMLMDILKAPSIIPSLIRLGISSRKVNRQLIQCFLSFLETIQ